jgi:hypothetical protein
MQMRRKNEILQLSAEESAYSLKKHFFRVYVLKESSMFSGIYQHLLLSRLHTICVISIFSYVYEIFFPRWRKPYG